MCTATIALMTKIATTAYVNIMNVVVAGSDILIFPCLSRVTLHYFVNKPDKRLIAHTSASASIPLRSTFWENQARSAAIGSANKLPPLKKDIQMSSAVFETIEALEAAGLHFFIMRT